jgi:hypothetical protein
VLPTQGLLGQLVGLLDEDLGEDGERGQRLFDGAHPQQVPDADVEDLPSADDAESVEPPLHGGEGIEEAVQLGLDCRAPPGALEVLRIGEPVEPWRTAHQDLGDEGARPESPGEELHRVRPLRELGEELRRPQARAHEALEVAQGLVRVRREGKTAEQLR